MIKDYLISLHKSDNFKLELDSLNQNLFNLKLEDYIRNVYVKLFNENFSDNYLCLAEYPRGNRKRVDMGICKKTEDKYLLEYTVEFKFMFSGDYTCFYEFPKSDKGFIKSVFVPDFERTVQNHKTDMFILILSDWGADYEVRAGFETQFEVPINSLNRYQYPVSVRKLEKIEGIMDYSWKENLLNSFNKYCSQNNVNLFYEESPIRCCAFDVKTDYHVFIIYR